MNMIVDDYINFLEFDLVRYPLIDKAEDFES